MSVRMYSSPSFMVLLNSSTTALQFGHISPQKLIFLIARLSNKAGKETKLSINNLCPTLSTLLLRFLTVAYITVISLDAAFAAFHK
jgi:hypothetical protein